MYNQPAINGLFAVMGANEAIGRLWSGNLTAVDKVFEYFLDDQVKRGFVVDEVPDLAEMRRQFMDAYEHTIATELAEMQEKARRRREAWDKYYGEVGG